MARVIAIFGTLLDPDLVVIGGAVAAAADLLLQPIIDRLPDYTSAPPAKWGTSRALLFLSRRSIPEGLASLGVTPHRIYAGGHEGREGEGPVAGQATQTDSPVESSNGRPVEVRRILQR